MADDENDTLPTGPLTESERKAVRALLRDEARYRWARGTARRFVAWLFGIITSLYVFQDHIATFVAKVIRTVKGV